MKRHAYSLLLSTMIVLAILVIAATWMTHSSIPVSAQAKTAVPKTRSSSFQPTTIPNDGTVITVETVPFTSTATASIAIWSDETVLIGSCCGGSNQPAANLNCKLNIDGNAIMSRDHTWYYTSDEGFDLTGSTTLPAGIHVFTLTCSSTLINFLSLTLESGGTTIAYAG